MNDISFSIVTVVYNCVHEIEKTIKSVVLQTYKNYEYIIIDGNSNDGTKDIIDKYQSYINVYISEDDDGIYYAMNKAIEVVSKKWVIFMNAGDVFFNDQVLEEVSNFLFENQYIDVLYGNTVHKEKNNFWIRYPLSLNQIERVMVFCHQSSFINSTILKDKKFNLNFRLASDYEMIYSLYKERASFRYLNINISIFNDDEGSTLSNLSRSTIERFSIHKDYGTLKNYFLCYYTIFLLHIKINLKKIIPDNLLFIYRKNKKMFKLPNM
jgi:glycosyltransferase involved in cell wall biosynthesis